MNFKKYLVLVVLALGYENGHAVNCITKKKLVTLETRLECMRQATLSIPSQTLTPQQLLEGPQDLPKGLGFKPNDPLHCSFLRPSKGAYGGESAKFFCVLTDESGKYYNGNLEIVPNAVAHNDDEELLDSTGVVIRDANGNKEKGIKLKVKYTEVAKKVGNIPDYIDRFHEVSTGIAATRILWAMGLAGDTEYTTETVTCKGCTADPSGRVQKELTGKNGPEQLVAVAATHTFKPFPMVVEYKTEGKTIEDATLDEKIKTGYKPEPKDEQGWTIAQLAKGYSTWSPEKQIDYLTMVTAINLVNHHNSDVGGGFQNRLLCPRDAIDPETSICSRPVAVLDDIGSTFARKGLLGNNRGVYSEFAKHKIFKSGCTFGVSLKGSPVNGLTKATKEAVLARMQNLRSRENIEAIFRGARFDVMDADQLVALKKSGIADDKLGEAAIQQWTDKFQQLVREIENAQCPN